MRELLTEKEIELLFAYADMDMRMQPTSAVTHYSRGNIWRTFTKIFSKTGINPREFWGLYSLMQEITKESADARQL